MYVGSQHAGDTSLSVKDQTEPGSCIQTQDFDFKRPMQELKIKMSGRTWPRKYPEHKTTIFSGESVFVVKGFSLVSQIKGGSLRNDFIASNFNLGSGYKLIFVQNQQFGPPQVMNQGGRRKMRLVKNSSNFDENAPKTIDAERLEDVITPDPKSSKEESLKDVSDVIKKWHI